MQGGKIVNNASHPFQLQKESIVVVLTLTLILDTFLEATSPYYYPSI
jgi:hypothetical protein